jgi:quinol---cytochrome c reductase iron-sulfur subunit
VKRSSAELLAAALLVLAAFAAAGFIVAYSLLASTQWLGVALGIAFLLIAATLILAGKRVAPGKETVEQRPKLGERKTEDQVVEDIESAGEGISRRGVLAGSAAAAGAALGGALIVPVASLGPKPGGEIGSSPWRRGIKLVNEDDQELTPDDVEIGTFITAFPKGSDKRELGSPIVVIKLKPSSLELPPERKDWTPKGVMAFSKICPHAGCAINLYRYPLYADRSPGPALVCPCHYSTFDPRTGGNRIFGPAGRALPQLPLALASDGKLIAGGPMSGSVGPSWWGVKTS